MIEEQVAALLDEVSALRVSVDALLSSSYQLYALVAVFAGFLLGFALVYFFSKFFRH